jgi:Uma2 family endonuclease
MSVIVDGKLKLTYNEYRLFPEDGNTHELIDGEHYMAPAPGTSHQSVSRHIQFQLYAQLEQAGEAQVFDAPTDVELSEVDVVQPDLAVVAASRAHIIAPSRIVGPPDLVVEITSASTAQRDRELKRRLYELRGVPVYWLVDPQAQMVTVYERDEPAADESAGPQAKAGGPYREAGRFHDEVRLEYGGLRATVDLTKVW